jgi:hypothetical protein
MKTLDFDVSFTYEENEAGILQNCVYLPPKFSLNKLQTRIQYM